MSWTFPFDTTAPDRNHLARTTGPVRVEGISQGHHRREILRREQSGHEFHLLDTNPVLARDASSQTDTFFKDLMTRLQDRPHLLGIAFVKQKDGVDIPVASMEDVGNPQVVTQTDGRDEAKDLG